MKALFIGGTGTISLSIVNKLAELDWDVYVINRGHSNRELSPKVNPIIADINDEEDVAKKISHLSFDVVADFLTFLPAQIERDYRLFAGKTNQYIALSSASAYQKPCGNYRINEGTPLANPFWQYSRDKIACEELLMKLYREKDFPVTIVRPSHTYDKRSVPLGVWAKDNNSWPVVKRMMEGKPVVIHGDGTSLWTMTHARDFAKGFIGLMGNIHAIGEAVQITSDESLTWLQIYQSAANALGVKLNPLYVSTQTLGACGYEGLLDYMIGDKSNTVVFDNTKLKRLVPGFCAATRVDQGMRESISFVLAHPEYQKDDPEFDEWCDKLYEANQRFISFVKGNS